MRAHPNDTDARLRDILARSAAKAREEGQPAPVATYTEEQLRMRRRAMRTHGFGLPNETSELIVEGRLYTTRPLSIAQAWLQAPTPVLVLIGDPGVGKSTALAWAALERVGTGPILYVLESTLAQWRFARREHAADWQRAIEASTVVIDELGATEFMNRELARVAVRELVHLRTGGWPRSRRTLIQGNLSLEDLDDVLDQRLGDRLEEIGVTRHIEGPSLRGKR